MIPVFRLAAVISTPGINAPVVSEAVPLNVAFICASTGTGRTSNSPIAACEINLNRIWLSLMTVAVLCDSKWKPCFGEAPLPPGEGGRRPGEGRPTETFRPACPHPAPRATFSRRETGVWTFPKRSEGQELYLRLELHT